MKRKAEEWLSLETARRPGRVVLIAILLFNILFLLIASFVISRFALDGTEKMNLFEAAFTTISMILDAGCVQFVISDIGHAGVAISIICLVIILVGMISFTGAVIGYLTNFISQYIEDANLGTNELRVSGHFVILNWNTRASEIINDLLYCKGRQVVVVLAESNKQGIEREVNDRLQGTIERENAALLEQARRMPLTASIGFIRKNRLKNNIVLIVREGDVFSSKELQDISLKDAKTIIILGNDERSAQAGNVNARAKGNPLTVKALMQVADIVSSQRSVDHQRIVVEVTDRWTEKLVEKIIENKTNDTKCKIVPVKANQILGQMLSQFSLMPELNLAYRELLSNKSNTFFSVPLKKETDEIEFVRDYLNNHLRAIPLTTMVTDGEPYAFFAASGEADLTATAEVRQSDLRVDLNHDYQIGDKYVVIIGHNSKCEDIMEGFASFREEWNDPAHEILHIIAIDDREHLEKVNYYKDYPFPVQTVEGTVYDNDLISELIEELSRLKKEDISILILSDDTVPRDSLDANVLANLVFAQDNIGRRMQESEFDPGSIDIIAEIIDPKHYDVVSSYSVRNIVISNRYISKMITQLGEKDALFDFYADILTYDDNSVENQSKEIYVKEASRFFKTLPPACRADELIRAIFEASVDASLPPEKINPTLLMGIVKKNGEMMLIGGDQSRIEISIEPSDKLIVFANH